MTKKIEDMSVSPNWWSNLVGCCNTCYTRKQGRSNSIPKVSGSRRIRVIVIGSEKVGKSRALSLLSGSEDSQDYVPTAGTNSTRIQLHNTEIHLLEVGGGLRPFWSRSLSDRTDGIWYMLAMAEVMAKDFASLTEFVKESSSKIRDSRIPLMITVLGDESSVDEEQVSKLISEAVSEAGVFEPPTISIIPQVSRESLSHPLEDLIRKLPNQ